MKMKVKITERIVKYSIKAIVNLQKKNKRIKEKKIEIRLKKNLRKVNKLNLSRKNNQLRKLTSSI